MLRGQPERRRGDAAVPDLHPESEQRAGRGRGRHCTTQTLTPIPGRKKVNCGGGRGGESDKLHTVRGTYRRQWHLACAPGRAFT